MWQTIGEGPAGPSRFWRGSQQYAEAIVDWEMCIRYVDRITRLAREPETEGLVLFVSTEATSPHYRRNTVMAVGAARTYKTASECEGMWLNDEPEERQHAQFWVDCRDKEELTDVIKIAVVRNRG